MEIRSHNQAKPLSSQRKTKSARTPTREAMDTYDGNASDVHKELQKARQLRALRAQIQKSQSQSNFDARELLKLGHHNVEFFKGEVEGIASPLTVAIEEGTYAWHSPKDFANDKKESLRQAARKGKEYWNDTGKLEQDLRQTGARAYHEAHLTLNGVKGYQAAGQLTGAALPVSGVAGVAGKSLLKGSKGLHGAVAGATKKKNSRSRGAKRSRKKSRKKPSFHYTFSHGTKIPHAKHIPKIQGTSPHIGNFSNLKGATAEEVISRIPKRAKRPHFSKKAGGATEGFKFQWVGKDGKVKRLRLHGPDPGAPPGSHAHSGWVFRYFEGTRSMAPDGNLHPQGIINARSPHYNPDLINETHIPLAGNPVLGGQK